MGFEKFISFFTGYVEVLIRGPHLEKLLNLLTSSGLRLWDVKRLGAEVIQAKIRAHGFLRIRQFIRRTNSTIKIHRKNGLPFIKRRIIRRKMFFIGAGAFIMLLLYLSSFVFFIKIDGFDGKDRQKLLQDLAKLGLKPGILRKDLLVRKNLIEREVMIDTTKAVWLGITVRGVVAEVKVVKRKIPPGAKKYCDIIAAKDGVISKMVVFRGMPLVNEGDTVARGDLLISGIEWLPDLEAGDLIKREVPASGIVEARVWYDLEVTEPKIIWQLSVKNSRYTEYKLRWGQKLWKIGGFGKKPPKVGLWNRWRRPIFQGRNPSDIVELIKDTWQAVIWRKVVRSRSEMEGAALKEINKKLIKLKRFENSSQVKTWHEEGNYLKLRLTIETVEDIGMIK